MRYSIELGKLGWLGKLFLKSSMIIVDDNSSIYIGSKLNELEDIKEKLDEIDKSLNKVGKKICSVSTPVWILNAKENKLELATSFYVDHNFIFVNGLQFARYDSYEEAMEEMDQIISWLSSENIMGTGVYQLTK